MPPPSEDGGIGLVGVVVTVFEADSVVVDVASLTTVDEIDGVSVALADCEIEVIEVEASWHICESRYMDMKPT